MSIELPDSPAALGAEPSAPAKPAKQVTNALPRQSNPWLQAIPLLIIIAAFVPMLIMHGIALWAKPHYQFFPLVIVGTLVLGYVGCQRMGRIHPGRYQVAAFLFGVLSLLGLAAGAFLQSSLVAFGSFLVGTMAFIYSWGGWALVKRWLPAWLFLWLIVPPPFNWDQEFITWLKFITARWTGYVLDVFGILHVMEGNVVIVPPYNQLLVEEACSGIHSFFAIITCALFFVFWFGRPFLHAVLLIAGSICWVLAANCARVVLIAVAQVRFNVDLAHGLRHDILGFVIFLFLVLLTLSLDRLLCFVFNSTYSFMTLFKKGRMVLSKMMDAQKKKVDLGTTRWPSLSVTWVNAKPIMAIALLLCVTNFGLAGLGLIEIAAPSDIKLVNALNSLGENAIPIRVGTRAVNVEYQWDRTAFVTPPERAVDDKLGRFSRSWSLRTTQLDEPATFSCDFPFLTGHDLTVCYTSAGWQKVLDKGVPFTNASGESDYLVEAMFRKPDGKHGYLVFSMMDEYGKPQIPRVTLTENVLQNRIRKLREALERRPSELRYQVQIFATAYSVINTAEQENVKQLFLNLRNRVTQGYLAARGGQ